MYHLLCMFTSQADEQGWKKIIKREEAEKKMREKSIVYFYIYIHRIWLEIVYDMLWMCVVVVLRVFFCFVFFGVSLLLLFFLVLLHFVRSQVQRARISLLSFLSTSHTDILLLFVSFIRFLLNPWLTHSISVSLSFLFWASHSIACAVLTYSSVQ